MMKTIGQASIRRSGDRRPLRLEIGRRRAHTAAGAEKFVTEVRYGDAAALVVPWRDGRRGAAPHRSTPDAHRPAPDAHRPAPDVSTRRNSAPVAS